MNKTCTIVFSKDRPAQLDLTLRGLHEYVQDVELLDVFVVYKPSTSRYRSLYRQVGKEHPSIRMIREGDFATDVACVAEHYENIMFLVDDTVFIRTFSVATAAEQLAQQKDVLGVSLRLGKNTTYCYPLDKAQRVPEMRREGNCGLWSFEWVDAECDFGYPLELSSSLYRTADLLPLFRRKEFTNPNTMENCMVKIVASFKEKMPRLLCLESSAAFSAPLNLVQTVCDNRVSFADGFDAASLAEAYARGDRLSVDHLMPFTPSGCHQEVEPRYIPAGEAVPLVSVVIPCYNQACYLEEAVESVKRQTFRDWEMIIVNDGSPDDTAVVAERIIASSDGCDIRVITTCNQGLAMARNAGIEKARGAYILCLDADDRIASTFLELTLGLLEQDRGIGIVYTDLQQFGGGSEFIQAAEFDPNRLPVGNQLNCCSLFRREIWEVVGGFNPSMDIGYEDWEFWIACAEAGFIAQRIPEPLFEYRVKESSMVTVAERNSRRLKARIVLNHFALYTLESVRKASRILSDDPETRIPGAPKVSVVVPTYQRPFRLAGTLESIASQTMKDFEVLVVSDGGVDTRFMVDRYRDRMCIRFFEHPANKGLSAARNTALRFARGKYIAYLDDDDIFYENHLKTLLQYLDTTGEKVVYSDAHCAREVFNGREYEIVSRDVLYSNDWDNDLILTKNLVPVLCVMHEKACIPSTGFFDEQLSSHEDWDFWIRLSRNFKFNHLPEVTCEFRERLDASSMTGSRRADFLRTAQIIMDKNHVYVKGRPDLVTQQEKLLHGLRQDIDMKGGGGRLGRINAYFRRRKTLRKQEGGRLEMVFD